MNGPSSMPLILLNAIGIHLKWPVVEKDVTVLRAFRHKPQDESFAMAIAPTLGSDGY